MTTDRHQQAVQMRLQGRTYAEIGQAIGVTKQRAQAMVEQAFKTGTYSVHVTVNDARGVGLEDVAGYLKGALKAAGVTTHRPGVSVDESTS